MNTIVRVGIDNIGYYIPTLRISIDKLIQELFQDDPKLLERMNNAIKTTGQRFMRITQKWQDSVCLATESILDMINDVSLDTLRFIISATETPVDASKPIASYLLGILKKLGLELSSNISTYQTQHACAGGTLGLIQAISLIASLKRESTAIVSMTDIARYEQGSTAEVTQGAGSVSLFVSKNPRLLELDVSCAGFCSEDTDDFFRPLNSVAAKVRGRYSMQCYLSSVYSALCDYCHNVELTVEEVLERTDYFCFHLPFAYMSRIALTHILHKKLHWSQEKVEDFLQRKCIQESSEIVANVGNTYTAATYFSLGHLLSKKYQEIKEAIVGKKVLILTYGSGNTAVVLAGTLAKDAPSVIESWSLLKQLDTYEETDKTYYQWWLKNDDPEGPSDKELQSLPPKSIYFQSFREDGYRTYQHVQ